MLHIQDQEFAQSGEALRSFADEWSCLEMFDEKLKCLKTARKIGELSVFIAVMTSEQAQYQKLSKLEAIATEYVRLAGALGRLARQKFLLF